VGFQALLDTDRGLNDDSFIVTPSAPATSLREPSLHLARRDGVAVLTLQSPPVNALGEGLVRGFREVLDEVAADRAVRVLHVRSGLKAFCAGADLAEMRARLGEGGSVDAQIAAVRELQALLARLEHLPLATVAELSGAAMGGGLELALACDFRVSAHDARLALPETRLGLLPGAGGTQRLTALCGPAVAKRLILGAEILDGERAAALGLVHWSVPAGELPTFAAALADRLAALPRAAVAAAKACIAAHGDPDRDGYELELSATRRLLSDEPETRARIEAFLAGRR
jgi:enoyl-CoA hydratase/carnithine racemase